MSALSGFLSGLLSAGANLGSSAIRSAGDTKRAGIQGAANIASSALAGFFGVKREEVAQDGRTRQIAIMADRDIDLAEINYLDKKRAALRAARVVERKAKRDHKRQKDMIAFKRGYW